MRRAVITVSPACTSVGEMKRPNSRITSHAKPFEPLLAVHGRDLGDDLVHMVLGGGIICLRRRHRRHAEGALCRLRMGRLAAAISALDGTQP